jgi:hypothetical protein
MAAAINKERGEEAYAAIGDEALGSEETRR